MEKNTLREYAERLARELLRQGRERTARAYLTAVRRLSGFTGNEEIRLDELDSSLLARFENALCREGRRRNTIVFYMSILRAIYNKALREGMFSPSEADIFRHVRTTMEGTRKRALSRQELTALHDLELLDPALNKARLVFLFSFFGRGISFVDLFHLRKENLADGVLSYTRRKTGQALEIKVTPQMRRVLHALSRASDSSPYLLPLSTTPGAPSFVAYESALRLQNQRLRKIEALSGLSKRLSTHVARHSWATIAKAANQPLPIISEGLGHTSVRTTAIYLASFDRSVLDKANDKVGRMIAGTGGWIPPTRACEPIYI